MRTSKDYERTDTKDVIIGDFSVCQVELHSWGWKIIMIVRSRTYYRDSDLVRLYNAHVCLLVGY